MNKKEIVLKECAVRGNDGTLKPSDQHSKPIDLPPFLHFTNDQWCAPGTKLFPDHNNKSKNALCFTRG